MRAAPSVLVDVLKQFDLGDLDIGGKLLDVFYFNSSVTECISIKVDTSVLCDSGTSWEVTKHNASNKTWYNGSVCFLWVWKVKIGLLFSSKNYQNVNKKDLADN